MSVGIQGRRLTVDGSFSLLSNLLWVDFGAKDRTRKGLPKPRGRGIGYRGVRVKV
jgi:hypothetical protein